MRLSTRRRSLSLTALALTLAGFPTAARADSPVTVDIGAGTYVPLAITAEGTVELPYRILVQGDLGWMPTPYSNTIVNLLGDFGALNAFETDLLKAAIENSLVARASAGWRPFASHGFEILAGYTVLAVGGSVSGTDVVNSFLEAKGVNDSFKGGSATGVPLSATLHNFHATLGWRFLLWDDKVVLRASVGYLQCFASSTSIDASPARPAEAAAVTKLNSEIQGALNPYFTTYVKAPIIGLTASYRF